MVTVFYKILHRMSACVHELDTPARQRLPRPPARGGATACPSGVAVDSGAWGRQEADSDWGRVLVLARCTGRLADLPWPGLAECTSAGTFLKIALPCLRGKRVVAVSVMTDNSSGDRPQGLPTFHHL